MAVEGPSRVSPWKDPVHVPGDKEHSSSEIQLPWHPWHKSLSPQGSQDSITNPTEPISASTGSVQWRWKSPVQWIQCFQRDLEAGKSMFFGPKLYFRGWDTLNFFL